MDNLIYIPELNPVLFFDKDRANIPTYHTKHFDKWMFGERIYEWQEKVSFKQVWQTTDIIKLQFESNFDPIIVKLMDVYGSPVITLPSLIGLPHRDLVGFFAFEVSMSLGDLPTGCYYLQLELGTGEEQKILISGCQFISAEALKETVLLEYRNSRFHKDVMFESGIEFQYRVPAAFTYLTKARADEQYRDEKYTNTILSSRSAKQFTILFGDAYGLPDDELNKLDEIWSCDHVKVDGKLFGIADGSRPEYPALDDSAEYPKRGMKLLIEDGINRNSRVFALTTDTTKKLFTSVIVDAQVFGDTSNQGSANTVPVFNALTE